MFTGRRIEEDTVVQSTGALALLDLLFIAMMREDSLRCVEREVRIFVETRYCNSCSTKNTASTTGKINIARAVRAFLDGRTNTGFGFGRESTLLAGETDGLILPVSGLGAKTKLLFLLKFGRLTVLYNIWYWYSTKLMTYEPVPVFWRVVVATT
jgi:hypothetical protein